MITLHEINKQRNAFCIENGYCPKIVHIHPVNKDALIEEANRTMKHPITTSYSKYQIVFGMRIKWDSDMLENEIKCDAQIPIQ